MTQIIEKQNKENEFYDDQSDENDNSVSVCIEIAASGYHAITEAKAESQKQPGASNSGSIDEAIAEAGGDHDVEANATNQLNQQQPQDDAGTSSSNGDQIFEIAAGDFRGRMFEYQQKMQVAYKPTTEPDWLVSFNNFCTKVESSCLPVQQVVIGYFPGLLTGCVLAKVGKVVAVLAGCSIVAVQLVDTTGFRKFEWTNVVGNVKAKKDKIARHKNVPSLGQVSRIFGKHPNFAAGFVGGILSGIGIV